MTARFALAVGDTSTTPTGDRRGTEDICSATLKSYTEEVNVGDALLIVDGKVTLPAAAVHQVDPWPEKKNNEAIR
ncbi:hypothetical protein [Arthrobacter sp. SD76]|uniref:hypothetical protein n=1 Tax=Arthrobacter sp. SD76 TaxID=3415007 RepID=UPI003C78F3A6